MPMRMRMHMPMRMPMPMHTHTHMPMHMHIRAHAHLQAGGFGSEIRGEAIFERYHGLIAAEVRACTCTQWRR